MKFTKRGEWTFGADDIEVQEGSLWVVNTNEFRTGFVCWDDGSLRGEHMALITEAPILVAELPAESAGWDVQVGFSLTCTNGDDKGIEVRYSTSSKGGKKLFKVVVDEVLGRMTSGKEDFVPLVTLAEESYKHKKFGKVYNPIFIIDGWTTMPDVGDEPDEAGADKVRAKREEKAEAAEEKAAPVKKTRRRRAAAA